MDENRTTACRSGFSLIETLVVVAVLMVVLSLVVVGVVKSRERAVGAACMANLRSCHAGISMYTADYKDEFPIQGEFRLLRSFNTSAYGEQDYYMQSVMWSIPANAYLGGGGASPSRFCAAPWVQRMVRDDFPSHYPEGAVLASDFWMSYAMITDPAAWCEGGDITDPKYFRAVRLAEVSFPSQKGLLIEAHAWHLGLDSSEGGPPRARVSIFRAAPASPFEVATADGACRVNQFSDLIPGWSFGTFGPERVVLSTPGGVRGIDLKQ